MPGQSIALETEVMVAGFRDCSYEALTYLIDVEKLPLDDPMVLGLQQYLVSREEEIRREQALKDAQKYSQGIYNHWNYYPQLNYGYPYYGYHGNQFLPQLTVPIDQSNPIYYGNSQNVVSMTTHLNDSLESIADSISDCESTACDSEVEDILMGLDENDTYFTSEIAETAETLNGLAENNDKIGNLLTELFGLMDEDEAESQLLQSIPLSLAREQRCSSS